MASSLGRLDSRMRSVTIQTPATDLPVSVSDCHLFLRLNTDDENDLISDWIAAAVTLFERSTGYCLLSQTLRLNLDGWPANLIELPRWPVSSVSTVQYLDTNDAWQTLSGWTTDTNGQTCRVILPNSLPQLHPQHRPTVRVTFVAGHSSTTDVPALVRTAIKLLVGHWYSAREAYGEAQLTDTPAGWKAVCDQYETGLLDMGQSGGE